MYDAKQAKVMSKQSDVERKLYSSWETVATDTLHWHEREARGNKGLVACLKGKCLKAIFSRTSENAFLHNCIKITVITDLSAEERKLT